MSSFTFMYKHFYIFGLIYIYITILEIYYRKLPIGESVAIAISDVLKYFANFDFHKTVNGQNRQRTNQLYLQALGIKMIPHTSSS